MFKDFEKDKGSLKAAGLIGAWLTLDSVPLIGWLHDESHRDWQSRLDQLDHQKMKIKGDIHGSMHHLAVVENGLLNQKIKGVKAHEPEQFGGLEGVEAMAGLILSGVVLATAATYGTRRAARFVREHNPLTA